MGLNKTQLIKAVAGKTGLTQVDADKAVRGTLESISEELAAGGGVTIIGFGTFSVFERSARTGKNPQTGESIKIPAKKVAKFKPGKALAEAVSNKPKKAAAKKKGKKK